MATPLEPTTKAKLKHILAKDINELTDYDKGFLRARIDYIGQKERDRLGDVLTESKGDKKAREQREQEAKDTKEQAEEQSRQDQNAHLEPVIPDDEEELDEDEDEEEDEAQG